ncbi:DUF2948 family protein [Lutimaribacter saemankumensis]|uniref:DUF2948 domain-containing protein n=1 Tax=Lutimaribacter saemankumensis TaxID=490829 RepID=A0A1G8MBC8_9RHOB|nr:DUF2948 family protein [Lutimaribacter saemankumensis]SDI64710.1 Protein of unknown function [Lutimaribacter saemankumensis]
MTDDARFEDGREAPLNLGALDQEDLKVISALVQDAVFPASEMAWRARDRRFALLLNRFRWEDRGRDRHGPERVQSLLVIENVLKVASQGVPRGDADTILSLLAIDWQPGEAPGGVLELQLAGDGAIRLEVEALEVALRDVTRPYRAPSRKAPTHDG